MKTKLTLTVRKKIVNQARRYSRRTGKSISEMFEELFEQGEPQSLKPEPQRAAERLLSILRSAKPIKTLNDKELLRTHVARKYS